MVTRKRKQNSSPELPRKKVRKERDIFDFPEDDDDDENELQTPVKKIPEKNASKPTTGKKLSAPKQKSSGIVGNGVKASPRTSNKKSTQPKETSPDSLEISDDDELNLTDQPFTPTKQPAQTPTKSKSTRKLVSLPEPPPSPVKSFRQKVDEDERKRKRSEADVLSEKITINGTDAPSIPSPKAPTAEELEAVKEEVLGKLVGRNPIPLIGHVAERARYIW
jgi:hypothetical protein